ncbi:MAG: ribosome silencing factor [Candidatus Eisenbacteria bacterium]|nr:ribosome silencing factor [Candidatus Eisenbacteria bacterium]
MRWTTRSGATADRTEPGTALLTPRPRAAAAPGALEIVRRAADAALSKKAHDLVALDLRDFGSVSDYFFICSASSDVQVKAVAEAIEERLREAGARPWHVEGLEGRRWVVLDYVDVVAHVFHQKTREYYMLDRLWGDARSVDLDLDPTD